MTRVEEVRLLWGRAADDTTYRTVASRAYYANFTRCMTLAQSRGFVRARDEPVHSQLAKYLKDTARHRGLQTANLLYRIGSTRLPNLKKLRTVADYEPKTEFTRGMAEEAVNLMDEIEGLMDQVEAEVAALAG